MLSTNDEGKFEIRSNVDDTVYAVGEVVNGVVHMWYGAVADGDPQVVLPEDQFDAAWHALDQSNYMTVKPAA